MHTSYTVGIKTGEYVHTYVDGNVVKGSKIEWSDPS